MKNNFLYLVLFCIGILSVASCSQPEQKSDANAQVTKTTKAEQPVAPNQAKKTNAQALTPAKLIKINKPTKMKSNNDKQLWQEGTLTFLNFEGGFFGIITNQGTKLLPMNLTKKFHQHKAKIRFKGEIQQGLLTIQQWGTPFKISAIELIAVGDDPQN